MSVQEQEVITDSSTVDYKTLYSQLQEQFNRSLEQSQELLEEFQTVKTQHNILTVKINSLINILEKLPSNNDNVTKPETSKKIRLKLNLKKEKDSNKPKQSTILSRLSYSHPHLKTYLNIIQKNGDISNMKSSSELESLSDLYYLRQSTLQSSNDSHYVHQNENISLNSFSQQTTPHPNASKKINQSKLLWLDDALEIDDSGKNKSRIRKRKPTTNTTSTGKGSGRGGNRRSSGNKITK